MRVDTHITIRNSELSRRQRDRLFNKLTWLTPDQSMFVCYRQYKNKIEIPRGAWHLVDQLDYYDERVKPRMPELPINFTLDDIDKDERFAGQIAAVEALLENEQGVIVRPPGTGKSKIGIAFAARAKTTSLILVHTKDLLDQWCDYFSDAGLGGHVSAFQGRNRETGHITVAMVQTLRRLLMDARQGPEWWAQFGAVIVDEVHHGGALTYDVILNNLPAYYRVGFTASLTRADGMQPYIKHLVGPVIHSQKFSSPVPVTVKPVYSGFRFDYRGRYDWQPLLQSLVEDEGRNKKIARIVDREIAEGNSVLVLSRRVEQLESIAECVDAESGFLIGSLRKDERRNVLREFKKGRIRCLFATQLADEAIDIPRLNRVVLAHPGKHEGRIIQQVGRALREHHTKTDAIIYDVVDNKVKPLKKQWAKRKRTYGQLKIKVKRKRLKIGKSRTGT